MSIRHARNTARAFEISLRSLEVGGSGREVPDLEDQVAPTLPRTRACGCVACAMVLVLVCCWGVTLAVCGARSQPKRVPAFLKRFRELRRDESGRLNTIELFPHWREESARMDDVVLAIAKIVVELEK